MERIQEKRTAILGKNKLREDNGNWSRNDQFDKRPKFRNQSGNQGHFNGRNGNKDNYKEKGVQEADG